MAAERPVNIFDANANLLGHLLEGLRTAYRLLDLMDALVGEAGKHNECSHRNLPYSHPSNRCDPSGVNVAISPILTAEPEEARGEAAPARDENVCLWHLADID